MKKKGKFVRLVEEFADSIAIHARQMIDKWDERTLSDKLTGIFIFFSTVFLGLYFLICYVGIILSLAATLILVPILFFK